MTSKIIPLSSIISHMTSDVTLAITKTSTTSIIRQKKTSKVGKTKEMRMSTNEMVGWVENKGNIRKQRRGRRAEEKFGTFRLQMSPGVAKSQTKKNWKSKTRVCNKLIFLLGPRKLFRWPWNSLTKVSLIIENNHHRALTESWDMWSDVSLQTMEFPLLFKMMITFCKLKSVWLLTLSV